MTRERAVIHHSVLCPKLMTAQAKQTAWGWVTCGSYFWLRHGVWDLCVINDDDVWTLSCFCAIVDGGQKISSPGEAFRFAPGLKKIVLVFLFLVIYSTGTQWILNVTTPPQKKAQFLNPYFLQKFHKHRNNFHMHVGSSRIQNQGLHRAQWKRDKRYSLLKSCFKPFDEGIWFVLTNTI